MSYLKHTVISICTVLLISSCATNKDEPTKADLAQLNGYFGDYSDLKPVKDKDKDDAEIRRWITSKDIKGKYSKLMVEPVVFYPEPKVSKQVTVETLQGIGQYTDTELKRKLAKSYQLVDQAGPGVARVSLAITGVTTDTEDLKFYQYIPVALIVTGVAAATGERDRVASMLVETLVTDSVTGEKLGMGLRKFPGKTLLKNDTEMLTVDLMKPAIDDNIKSAVQVFDQILK
ncbi:MAG: DUF3313 domain-containing protein [Gammaproteobacteria bacterium]|nr:DUF3313 domain-containing protein [Gammaproteobacteria bacterium]